MPDTKRDPAHSHAAAFVFELAVKGSVKSRESESFDKTVRDFVNDSGKLILISDDAMLIKTVRNALPKLLNTRDCVTRYPSFAAAEGDFATFALAEAPVIVMVERILEHKPVVKLLEQARRRYPNIKFIVTTNETSRENLALLYEVGIANVITKPASAATIIEKIASVIRPQTVVGQMVDSGQKLLAYGDHARALEVCDSILAHKPNSPAGLMLKGDALHAAGKNEEAIAAYKEANKAAKLFLDPIKRLVDIYKEIDEELHFGYLQKLDVISPLNVERKMEIGKIYVKKNDLERANEYFQGAVAVAQKEAMEFVESIIHDVTSVLAERAPALAEKYFTQILDLKRSHLSRDDMQTFNLLGIALRKQNKYAEAVENYERAIKICDTDPAIYYNMGLAYFEFKQYAKAMGCYEKALSIDPLLCSAAAEVAHNVAQCYIVNGNPKAAIELLQSVGSLFPQDAGLHELLLEARRKA